MFKNMKSAISLEQLEKPQLRDYINKLENNKVPSTYDYCSNNPFYRKSLDIIKEQYLLNSSLEKYTINSNVK